MAILYYLLTTINVNNIFSATIIVATQCDIDSHDTLFIIMHTKDWHSASKGRYCIMETKEKTAFISLNNRL